MHMENGSENQWKNNNSNKQWETCIHCNMTITPLWNEQDTHMKNEVKIIETMIIHKRQPWLTELSESVKGTFVNIYSHFLVHLLFGMNSGRRLQSFGNWDLVSFSQDRWNHLYGHSWLSQAIIVSVSPWRQMQNASVESLVVSFEFFGVRTGGMFLRE